MTTWLTEQLGPQAIYKLLVGSVVPRPIAWVSSRSHDGTANIAPFSFFNVAARQPPMLAFSVGSPRRGAKQLKDTLQCIREREDFVVNIADEGLLDQLVLTSVDYPIEVDEFTEVGLTPMEATVVSAPIIAEAPVSMECTLERLVPLGGDVLVIGEVVCFHVRDAVSASNYGIDTAALRPIGRMAGPTFCTGLEAFERKPDDVLRDAASRSEAP